MAGILYKKLINTKSIMRTIIIFILIAAITTCVSCSKIDDKDINQNIINTITEIEKSNYELNTLKITYDEYSQRTDKYKSQYFTSFYKRNFNIFAEDDLVFLITGKHYEEKDWKGLSLIELKKIGEPLAGSIDANMLGYIYTSYDISKIYDDNSSSDISMHYKHLFIRHTFQWENKNYTSYKQYTFKREENAYVLFSIRGLYLDLNKEPTYGREKVEFSQNINLE